MPNSIKYSTSAQTDALGVGNMHIGVGGKGPTSTTGFYTGINPPSGGYTVYYNKASGGPSITTKANDAALIAEASGASGETFSTIAQALTYYAGQDDKMVMFNPINFMVTDGLFLNLSANILPSYPRSGTTCYDLSGEENNGSLTNGISFDENSEALIFDGVDDILFAGVGTDYPFKHHSWEVWFKSSTADFNGLGGLVGLDYGRYASLTTAGAISYQLYSNMSQPNVQLMSLSTTGVNLLDDKWHQVICSRGSVDGEIWVDGVKNNSTSNGGNPTWNGINQWSTMASRFGDNPNNVGYKMEGEISCIRIYNKQLSSAEVLQNYYQGSIVTDGLVFAADAGNLVSFNPGETTAYNLAGDNDMSLLNGLGWGNSSNGYFSSDGVDDGLHTSDASNLDLDDFTLEGWVWWDQHKNYGSLLVKGPGGSGNLFNYCFFFYATSIIVGAGTGESFHSVNIAAPSINTWHHIVGTYDGATMKLYLNGTLAGSTTVAITPYQNSNDLQVIQNAYPIDGRVGAARLYNRALTSEEVQQNYNANINRFN